MKPTLQTPLPLSVDIIDGSTDNVKGYFSRKLFLHGGPTGFYVVLLISFDNVWTSYVNGPFAAA